MQEEDRGVIYSAQRNFAGWIMEKLEDYLFSYPDEDEVRCELYFRRGNEEQVKTRVYLKPKVPVCKEEDE